MIAVPLLTFSVLKDELLSKAKLTTFRFNAERWEKFHRTCFNKPRKNALFVWWLNPRFLHRLPGVYKMGVARWTGFETPIGRDVTDEMARLDGLKDKDDLLKALAFKNGMTIEAAEAHRWARIIFEWMFGPFTQEQSKQLVWDTLIELQNQAVAPDQRCPWCGLIGTLVDDSNDEKVIQFYRCEICGRTWG